MHPVLFKIGPLTVYSYGFMVALGFLIALFLANRAANAAGSKISPGVITDLSLLILFSGIIGARLLYVMLNLRDFLADPIEIFMVQHGGLSFYGGVITGFAAALIFLKIKSVSMWDAGGLIIPYVALAQAIGRLGCFLNGCCFGRPTDSFLGVVFPGSAQAIHPTQLYSSLLMIFLYGFLRLLQKLGVKGALILISYGLLYSAGRFVMEFYRGDNTVFLLGLTFSQIVSAVLFIFCVILRVLNNNKYLFSPRRGEKIKPALSKAKG